MGGDERAPCAARILDPISESSPVVTPGRTSAAMARKAFATMTPQARSFSNCSAVVMDIIANYRSRAGWIRARPCAVRLNAPPLASTMMFASCRPEDQSRGSSRLLSPGYRAARLKKLAARSVVSKQSRANRFSRTFFDCLRSLIIVQIGGGVAGVHRVDLDVGIAQLGRQL